MNETPPSTTASPSSNTLTADVKISNDLLLLKEKMDLLDSMLHPVDIASPKLSVLTNDAIRVVIGYLDACAPRMVELVEACTITSFGVVSEENLCDVFACNDRLQLLLSDVDTRMLTETPASTTSAKAATATTNVGDSRDTTADGIGSGIGTDANTGTVNDTNNNNNLTDQFGDLLLGNEDPFADAHGSGGVPSSAGATATATATTTTTPVLAGAKTTGESNDDFKLPATTTTTTTATESDPFDDFFAERNS